MFNIKKLGLLFSQDSKNGKKISGPKRGCSLIKSNRVGSSKGKMPHQIRERCFLKATVVRKSNCFKY